ncbi:hypothetical protein J6590_028315 [Homalodisca vitripennis]|nr:hypothetical protein J6590_028315 [Homalodisca vitripennis]
MRHVGMALETGGVSRIMSGLWLRAFGGKPQEWINLLVTAKDVGYVSIFLPPGELGEFSLYQCYNQTQRDFGILGQ